MGSLTLPTGGSVYIDANAIIYSVERVEPYRSLLAPMWEEARAGRFTLASSELVALETLIRPLRDGNARLEMLFPVHPCRCGDGTHPRDPGNLGRRRPYPRRDGLGDTRRPPRGDSSPGRLHCFSSPTTPTFAVSPTCPSSSWTIWSSRKRRHDPCQTIGSMNTAKTFSLGTNAGTQQLSPGASRACVRS